MGAGKRPNQRAPPAIDGIRTPYLHYDMAAPRFEWDPRKDAENQRKHRISFEEAQSVFADEHALLLDDPDHSTTEDRFILVGLSSAFRVLVVVHTYRRVRGHDSHHLSTKGNQT